MLILENINKIVVVSRHTGVREYVVWIVGKWEALNPYGPNHKGIPMFKYSSLSLTNMWHIEKDDLVVGVDLSLDMISRICENGATYIKLEKLDDIINLDRDLSFEEVMAMNPTWTSYKVQAIPLSNDLNVT